MDWPRWWLLDGFPWSEGCELAAGPLVVCDAALLIRMVEEGRPARPLLRKKARA